MAVPLLSQSESHFLDHQLRNVICRSIQTALFRFLVLVFLEILEEFLWRELAVEKSKVKSIDVSEKETTSEVKHKNTGSLDWVECDRMWQNVTECDRMWQNVTEISLNLHYFTGSDIIPCKNSLSRIYSIIRDNNFMDMDLLNFSVIHEAKQITSQNFGQMPQATCRR
jgi:hypothetical protein